VAGPLGHSGPPSPMMSLEIDGATAVSGKIVDAIVWRKLL
jgi:hypothetical protein